MVIGRDSLHTHTHIYYVTVIGNPALNVMYMYMYVNVATHKTSRKRL